METNKETTQENPSEKKNNNWETLVEWAKKITKDAENKWLMSLFNDFIESIDKNWGVFGAILAIFWLTKTKTSKLKNEIEWSWDIDLKKINWKELNKNQLKDAAIEIATNFWIPTKIFLDKLIKHENASWNHTIKNKKSTAYWITQMTDSTFKKYGKWLDRDNPIHQLVAWARYLSYIKKKNKCSWQEAVVYYNTWEYFDKNSNRPVKFAYIDWNLKPIVWKIPGCKWKTAEELEWKVSKKEYWEAAKKYYA